MKQLRDSQHFPIIRLIIIIMKNNIVNFGFIPKGDENRSILLWLEICDQAAVIV